MAKAVDLSTIVLLVLLVVLTSKSSLRAERRGHRRGRDNPHGSMEEAAALPGCLERFLLHAGPCPENGR